MVLPTPTTEDGYLELCAGKAKNRGNVPMAALNVARIFSVSITDVWTLVNQLVEYIEDDVGLFDCVLNTSGNSKEARAAKACTKAWLQEQSDWATPTKLAVTNNTVPAKCKSEAILYFHNAARERIRKTNMQSLATEGFRQRSASRSATPVSPARSVTNMAARTLGTLAFLPMDARASRYPGPLSTGPVNLDNPMLRKTTLRTTNIRLADPAGKPLKDFTFRFICNPVVFADRSVPLVARHADFDLFEAQLQAVCENLDMIVMRYHGYLIRNQFELEAALNDFLNGLRTSDRFNVIVKPRARRHPHRGMSPEDRLEQRRTEQYTGLPEECTSIEQDDALSDPMDLDILRAGDLPSEKDKAAAQIPVPHSSLNMMPCSKAIDAGQPTGGQNNPLDTPARRRFTPAIRTPSTRWSVPPTSKSLPGIRDAGPPSSVPPSGYSPTTWRGRRTQLAIPPFVGTGAPSPHVEGREDTSQPPDEFNKKKDKARTDTADPSSHGLPGDRTLKSASRGEDGTGGGEGLDGGSDGNSTSIDYASDKEYRDYSDNDDKSDDEFDVKFDDMFDDKFDNEFDHEGDDGFIDGRKPLRKAGEERENKVNGADTDSADESDDSGIGMFEDEDIEYSEGVANPEDVPTAGEEIDDIMAEAANHEDVEQQVMTAAIAMLNKDDAGIRASRADIEDWKDAADTFGITIQRLSEQSTSKERYIPLPASLGLNKNFGLMAHQVVGTNELHRMTFGELRGAVMADYMGLGKTFQCLVSFYMNLLHVMTSVGAKTPPSSTPFFKLDEHGEFKKRKPCVGATFISANANGIRPWLRDWVTMFKDSWAMDSNTKYKPKLILLHGDSKAFCDDFGGEANGLHHQLKPEDLREILQAPDWSNARPSFSENFDLFGEKGEKGFSPKDYEWTGKPNKRPHPEATTARPAHSSTRFLIVSTNGCWASRVWDVIKRDEKTVKQALHKIKMTPARNTKQLREGRIAWQKALASTLRNGKDGKEPNMVTRQALWKPTRKNVTMVCDLFYAAAVYVDELHSAGGESTITYKSIINPFNSHPDPAVRPAFVAVSGSMLSNGITTGLIFSERALRRADPTWKSINDKTIQSLVALDGASVKMIWDRYTARVKKSPNKTVGMVMQEVEGMEKILRLFGEIMLTYFISRTYDSVDPWGKKLNIMDCELIKKYACVTYAEEYHAKLKLFEDNLAAEQAEQFTLAMAKYNKKIKRGKKVPMPTRKQASTVNATTYGTARLLAIFPNFLDALRDYEDKHPPEGDRIIGHVEWGDSLGGNNRKLEAILSSQETISKSILANCIDEICKGSVKMKHIVSHVHKISNQTSRRPDPKDPARVVRYRSKYCLATNVRLAKALVYLKLKKEFGEHAIAYVGMGNDKTKVVDQWRKFVDKHGEIDDTVYIMVAGLRTICQSMDLIEGHEFEGLEPHPINAEATQYSHRGYRVGQYEKLVYVTWLVHKGSAVEEAIQRKNMAKDSFAHGVNNFTIKDDAMEVDDMDA